MPLPISAPVYAILRAHIQDRTGIHFGPDEADVLVSKVSPRAEEAGFQSLLDYYYFLRYDPRGPAELDALVEHLVVRETYLFREFDQLRTVVRHLIAPRVARGERVRLWSAACATGEEPLSLAVLLAEAGLFDKVDMVASDISRASLDMAQTGRFSRRSLRALPPESRHWRSLRPTEGGAVEVDPNLVSRVQWSRVNLIDAAAVAALGSFDVILCRNVLIYFDDNTTRAVVDGLVGNLRPDGVLLVSVTESLMRFGTSLICEEHDSVFFYRKAKK
ncbi:MAG TPA: CheR family methyltransferase [Polyangia bacterium]